MSDTTIRFNNISFSYESSSETLFQDQKVRGSSPPFRTNDLA